MRTPKRRGGLYEECRKEMLLRAYSPKTAKAYLSWIRSLVEYSKPRHPRELDNHDLREFLVYLIEKKRLAYASVNQALNALRFLYVELYKKEVYFEDLPRSKKGKSLPVVLNKAEMKKLLKVVNNFKHKMVLSLIYSSGLRLSETANLRLEDIDGERMLVYVRKTKFRKDRYTILSKTVLTDLRKYYKKYRPKTYLFEGKRRGKKYSVKSIQEIIMKARKKANIRKHVTIHTLRHTFATHLTEQGVSLRVVQELLGHEDPRTTEIYTHVSTTELSQINNPLDNL